MEEDKKSVHSIILDAGPLITNTPSISTLLKKSEEIFTTPSVISEVKDANARNRLETLVIPFITLRTPRLDSMKFVTEFAKKSGDLAVLSKTDLEIIALAYELECERNGGDWRLRKTPGQKTVNGPPPSKIQRQEDPPPADEVHGSGQKSGGENSCIETGSEDSHSPAIEGELHKITRDVANLAVFDSSLPDSSISVKSTVSSPQAPWSRAPIPIASLGSVPAPPELPKREQEDSLASVSAVDSVVSAAPKISSSQTQSLPTPPESDLSSDGEQESEGGEWITPSNITRHKTSTAPSTSTKQTQPKTLQVATLTADHALQNTLLLINLNLLSSSLTRISHVKSHILRCHACFATTKQMEKQFCPRCGQPTLTRVTISTNADGTTSMHLKKNMQWNTRGDRYSIPRPVAGTSNGKMREKGGGKGGWGRDLILAEDQKEYVRAVQDREREKRKGQRDQFDQDFLPGLIGGNRGHAFGGKIQVGAGRTVNSRKRK